MSDDFTAAPVATALATAAKAGEADIALVNPQAHWDLLGAARALPGKADISLPALGVPSICINYGPEMRFERRMDGRRSGGIGSTGHLSLLSADVNTRWLMQRPGDLAIVFLNKQVFDHTIEAGMERDARSINMMPKFLIRDLTLERIAHRLLRDATTPGRASRMQTEDLAYKLAEHLLGAHSNAPAPKRIGPRTMPPAKLKRAEDYIMANLGCDLSLQKIADAAGMTMFHFAKAFKQATGQTPIEYVKEQRVRQARSLLHNDRLSIAEVAKAVGYSHSYFTSEFRAHMHMTPSEFRSVLRS